MKVTPISIGNGIEAYIKINGSKLKKKIKNATVEDGEIFIKVGNFIDISDSEERVISPNYIPSSRTAVGFSMGLEQGGGRIIAETFDKDVCNFLIKTAIENYNNKDKNTDYSEVVTSGITNIKTEPNKTTKEKVYLDSVSLEQLPVFDLILMAKGSALRSITSDSKLFNNIETDGADVIFKKVIEKIKLFSSGFSIESEMGISAEVFSFMYFGDNVGWDKSSNEDTKKIFSINS